MTESTGPSDRSRPRREFSEAKYPLQGLTRTVIAAAFTVFRKLGFGFNEAVYRRALAVELRYLGVTVREEVSYEVPYRGVCVGHYRADLVAGEAIIVETKTGVVVDPFAPEQLVNCLCAAKLRIGLVIDFGPRGARIKRCTAPLDGRKPRTPDATRGQQT
jgi:GxxExxY protein